MTKIGTVVLLSVLAAGLCLTTPGFAQEDAASITSEGNGGFVINLRDADIRTLSEQVAEITGRTLVLDPAVTGTVTVLSPKPMTSDEVWDLFQSVLATQGLSALPSGPLWRIVAQGAAKESGGRSSTAQPVGRLDVVTRLIPLENFPATTAVAALRPLVAAFGYLEAVPDTNTLIITDTAENTARIEDIARALDRGRETAIFTIPIRNGDATEIAAALQNVLGQEGTIAVTKISVDTRANVLLVSGDAKLKEKIVGLVAELDKPGRTIPSTVPVTRVYALQFADAAALAEVLQALVSGGAAATNPVAMALQPEQAAQDAVDPVSGLAVSSPVVALGDEDITIQPVKESNSLVIRARAEVQSDLAALIAQLDERRPQVLIEAAIVEVSGDIGEQLGVQLGIGAGAAPPGGFAATSFSGAGTSLDNILRLLGSPVSRALDSGIAIGLSRQDQFGLLLQAFGQSNKARLLSTPSLTTLDNQPAEIVVGQNVPFRTGSFSTDGGSGNPFTTIERRDIGITMNVVPRVNKGDVVQLDITQEVSSLLNTNVTGAADLVTNRRSIKTTVLADNGGVIVLGGLITDDRQSSKSQVPGLGKLPVIGGLFRSRQESARRQTLFVFLRPTILRDRADSRLVTSDRFERLEAIDTEQAGDEPGLLSQPRRILRPKVELNGIY